MLQGSVQGRSSLGSARMRSHMHGSNSTSQSYDSYSERRQAEVARNVHDMNHRHSGDRSSTAFSTGLSREESLVSGAVLEESMQEGEARRGSVESIQKSSVSAESRRVGLLSCRVAGCCTTFPLIENCRGW